MTWKSWNDVWKTKTNDSADCFMTYPCWLLVPLCSHFSEFIIQLESRSSFSEMRGWSEAGQRLSSSQTKGGGIDWSLNFPHQFLFRYASTQQPSQLVREKVWVRVHSNKKPDSWFIFVFPKLIEYVFARLGTIVSWFLQNSFLNYDSNRFHIGLVYWLVMR